MLHGINVMCVWATLMCALCTGGRAVAQASAAEVLAAGAKVNEWVRGWEVVGEGPEVLGAAVIVREAGAIIGQGVSMGDPSRNLEIATRQAMVRAGNKLPTERDAVWARRVGELMLSVELAGALVPVGAAGDSEFASAVSAGLDGVAVRVGDRIAARFPSQMMAAGEEPVRAAKALVAELSGDATRAFEEFGVLREAGYAFYRFRTEHVAQVRAGAGMVFLHRGGRLVRQSMVDTTELVRSADAMALHLSRRMWPGVEAFGLMGSLDPVSGRHASRAEGPAGQAFAASALLRYAGLKRVAPERASAARELAERIIRHLAVVVETEREPWSAGEDAAACVVALTDALAAGMELGEAEREMLERCGARVLASFSAADGAFDPAVPVPAWGLVALAHARLAEVEGSGVTAAMGDACARAVYRQTPAEQLISQMPWLAQADLERVGSEGGVPAGVAMLDLRASMWRMQLTTGGLEPAEWDQAGGLALTGAGGRLASWHSVRALSWVSMMLADERLTSGTLVEGEAASELQRALGLARFAIQLSADVEEGHRYRSAERARGGVRVSVWDERMPTEATAMGLEGLSRLIDAVDEVAARGE